VFARESTSEEQERSRGGHDDRRSIESEMPLDRPLRLPF